MIETNRLLLRKFVKDDYQAMYDNWASDDEVTKYLNWPTHKDIDTTKQIINSWIKDYDNDNTHRYGIVYKDNNELIGSIDIVGYIDDKPMIGYVLSRKYWNQGIMSEACKAFLQYLKDKGFKEVIIEAMVDNVGSNKIIQKSGGELIDSLFLKRELKNDIVDVNRYLIKL